MKFTAKKATVLTPIMLGLLVLPGCATSTVPYVPTSTTSMSTEVQGSIEDVFDEYIGVMMDNPDFATALLSMKEEGTPVRGFEEELEILDSLVVEDENFDLVQQKVQLENGLSAQDSEVLAKAYPAMLTSLVLNSESEDKEFFAVVDPSAFDLRDGIWYGVKEGAVAYVDDQGRYVDFSLTGLRGASFTSDGKNISLGDLAGKNIPGQDADNPAVRDVTEAAKKVNAWLIENSDSSEMTTAKAVNGEVLSKFNPEGKTKIKLAVGDDGDFYGITGKGSNGEEVLYDYYSFSAVIENVDLESISDKEALPEGYYTDLAAAGQTLTNAYENFEFDKRPEGNSWSPSKDQLSELAAVLNANSETKTTGEDSPYEPMVDPDTEWSVGEDGSASFMVVTLDGQDYEFSPLFTSDRYVPDSE